MVAFLGLRRVLSVGALCLLTVGAGACVSDAGAAPPSGVLNFPIAMAAHVPVGGSEATHLIVANSNFDLTFRAATLQSYDLSVLNQLIDEGCVAAGVDGADCSVVVDRSAFRAQEGAVTLIEPAAGQTLLAGEVRIGSFADGITRVPDSDFYYLPIRADADITRVRVEGDGSLYCGNGVGMGDECDSAHTSSDVTPAASRDEELPTDPVDLVVVPMTEVGRPAEDGNFVVMAHRGGEASLFIDPGEDQPLVLTDVMTGLASNAATLAHEPDSGLIWVSSSTTLAISRIFVGIDDQLESLVDAQLSLALTMSVRGVASSVAEGDVRQVVFDPRPDHDEAYIVTRSPSSLLTVRREPVTGEFTTLSLIPESLVEVGVAPSRVTLLRRTIGGVDRVLALVSCFGTRDIYVVDVDLGAHIATIRQLSGPFELAIDEGRDRLYVNDFRTSVIRVVDLSPMLTCLEGGEPHPEDECAPRLIGMLGLPEASEELQ